MALQTDFSWPLTRHSRESGNPRHGRRSFRPGAICRIAWSALTTGRRRWSTIVKDTRSRNTWGAIMKDSQGVIEEIRRAFGGNAYPGKRFLQGSFEGCEPYEEVGPFEHEEDWRSIDAGFLEGHANAPSFFSEAGFRYFLPAYLLADLRDQLQTADPLFHLTHGFSDWTTEVPARDRTFKVRHGRTAFINPRRYGAMR